MVVFVAPNKSASLPGTFGMAALTAEAGGFACGSCKCFGGGTLELRTILRTLGVRFEPLASSQ